MKITPIFTPFVILVFSLQSFSQLPTKPQRQSVDPSLVKEAPSPLQCSLVKVLSEGNLVSTNGETKVSRNVLEASNGIALTSKIVMVMDHALIGDSTNVKVILETRDAGASINETLQAKVIARDHHYDVGLIEIEASSKVSLIPCALSNKRPAQLANTVLKGFKNINTHLIEIPLEKNAFFDQRSKNLEVPGLNESLEFQLPGTVSTLSGSPLIQANEVIAILNATNNNSAFAAYAADLAPVAFELLREVSRNQRSKKNEIATIDRNYTYDPVKGQFEFSGLIVRGSDQFEESPSKPATPIEQQQAARNRCEGTVLRKGEGTVHRKGEGTVHFASDCTVHRSSRSRIYGREDFSNTPVSGGDGLGFVIARLNPKKVDELRNRHPELVDRLNTSIDNTIRIYKIGDSSVRNIFQLLQVLAGSRSDYRITEAITKFQPITSAQNPYAASTHDALRLMQKIADNEGLPRAVKSQATEQLRTLIGMLSALDSEARKTSGATINSASIEAAKAHWSRMDDARSNGILFQMSANGQLGREELSLRNAIRARVPFSDLSELF